MSSDTIYSYYKVHLTKDTAINLGYLSPSYRAKMDYNCTLNGRVCVRIDRPPKNHVADNYQYKISYSFCSPSDNFSRKTARNICRTRINSSCHIVINSDKPLKARELTQRAITYVYEEANKNMNEKRIQSKACVSGVGAPIKVPDWFSLSNIASIQPDFRRR